MKPPIPIPVPFFFQMASSHVCLWVSQTIVFAIVAITLADHLPEIARHFTVLPSNPVVASRVKSNVNFQCKCAPELLATN